MKSIGIGSKTSTDGEVIEGNSGIMFNGLVATSVGQKATCPKCKKGWGYIVAVGPREVHLPAGPAAREGDLVACGCPEGENTLLGEGSVFIGSATTNSRSLSKSISTQQQPQVLTSQLANVIDAVSSNTCYEGEDLSQSHMQEFSVTDIPEVMRNQLDWPKSAELMELWFSLPARKMTDNEKRNKVKANQFPPRYIKRHMFPWSWLTQFESVKNGKSLLISRLGNPSAKDALRETLAKLLPFNPVSKLGQTYQINNDLNPITLHSHWQFQRAVINYSLGQIDDLYGSLGNFALYAAITKAKVTVINTTPHETVYHVDIHEAGIYMRDTYDFNGSQYLGHWDFVGMALSPIGGVLNSLDDTEWKLPGWNPSLGIVDAFGNEDYADFRTNTGRGGDLLLFSDVILQPVQLSINVEVHK